METAFEKQNFNEESEKVIKKQVNALFSNMGFNAKNINVSFLNGCSVYVSLIVKVLQPGKMPACVYVENGFAHLSVRDSDHDSNLNRINVSGNKMTMTFFKKLAENNIIN